MTKDQRPKSNDYDIHEPTIGHFNRFQAKLEKQKLPSKRKNNRYKFIAVAASLLLLISIGFSTINSPKGIDLANVSPKMEETQDYFNSIIHQELEKITKIKNTKNEKIINDAFEQLQFLENDYKNHKLALSTNSKNKNIIYAMINNYQQRIDVLQNLLKQLKTIKNTHSKYENNSI